MSDEIPDGWTEEEWTVAEADGYHEVSGKWVNDDRSVVITTRHSVSEQGHVSYPVTVEQAIESGTYRTSLEVHEDQASNGPRARKKAIEMMQEIEDGRHLVYPLGHEVWREYVQFYVIHDDEVPGSLTAEDLIEAIDTEQTEDAVDVDYDDIDESDVDEIVTVDIYPRHTSLVETTDDEEDED